jgi:hypothetical protein
MTLIKPRSIKDIFNLEVLQSPHDLDAAWYRRDAWIVNAQAKANSGHKGDAAAVKKFTLVSVPSQD